MRLLTLVLITGMCGWAQVGAPFLGYFEDGGRVREAHGIAASSTVSEVLPGEFSKIAAASGSDYLVVAALDTGEVSVLRPGRGKSAIQGVTAAPDRIILSPLGNAAALWFASNKRIQIVKGLPDAPAVREIDAAFLGDAPEALAVSDGGDWVAGAWADGLHAFGPEGQANWVPLEGTKRTMAFFHGSRDMAIATSTGLYRIADLGGRSEVSLLLSADVDSKGDALDPLAVGLTLENRRVVVADKSGRVISVELASGAATRVDCTCAAQGLYRLSRSVFRLTGLEARSYRLFDAETGDVLFAPLTAQEGEQQ